jgi:small-conductance mechanosensitive channel
LHKTASKTAATLASAKTKPALESELHELAGLAQRISDDLDRLGSASKSDQRLLANQLQRAADQSNRIAESLK